jgi:hypothetical protein
MRRERRRAKAGFEKSQPAEPSISARWSSTWASRIRRARRASAPQPMRARLGRRRAATRIRMAFLLLMHLAAHGQEHAPGHASPARRHARSGQCSRDVGAHPGQPAR